MEEGPPTSSGRPALLRSFGRCLCALLPVYLAGYWGLGLGVVLLGLAAYTGYRHNREQKQARLQSAMYLQEDAGVFRSQRDLPAWVNFPDVEKVEWLNKVLRQAWPFIGQYVEKLLVETVAASIRESSVHLQTLGFTKVDLGDRPLRVVGVKAHTEHDRRQVLLDLHISYVGDVEINVEVKKYFCKAGVKGIQLHGKLRVILEPLIGDVPFVGAITMFFIRRPKLDINWTGLTNLLDIPGLNVMSDSMIMDAIASFLVLPNRLTVPLVANLHVAQLRSPLPRGIVRIHLLEAENLAAKDNYIKGVLAGKSDPYAVVRVGTQTFTSRHVDNNLNPQWREMYEVIVHEVPGQELEVDVFDKDPDQDDFLGRIKLDLDIVKKARILDEWFPLKDAQSGQIHLRLDWLALLPSAERLSEVLQRNTSLALSSRMTEPPSAAILAVYLDRAQDLPMKKGNKYPSPIVQFSVQDTTRESRTSYGTNSPIWEDAFTFFIQNPQKQDLDIQVKDDDRSMSLGCLSVPLSRLLMCPELTMDQWFQLDRSGPGSRIYLNIVLRILWLDEEAVPVSPMSLHPTSPSTGPSQGGGTSEGGSSFTPIPSEMLPQHTSPESSFASEGVLRIHLVEARNLVAKDKFMGKAAKSDPYVKVRVGGMTFKSHVIKENLNPTWNEMYEVVLTQLPGQEVQLELFDKDLDEDDFLGRLKISLRDLISAQLTDQWYTLTDVQSGQVHLQLEWLPTVTDPARLTQIMQFQSQQVYQNKSVPAAALLFVFVERGLGLPLKKSGKEPKVGAELVLNRTTYRTKICDQSTSPRWDEACHFLVRDPREDILIVKLSHSWGQALGSAVLPVRELLLEEGLLLDRWLPLDGALPESQVLLRAELKLLDSARNRSDCGVTRGDITAEKQPGDVEITVPAKEAPTAANLRHRAVPSSVGADAGGSDQRAQVKMSLIHSSAENRLVITVHACRNLPACSKEGSDPYVTFALLPDKGKTTKRKTGIKKKDLNPEYNERFDLDLLPEEAAQRRLDLTVKHSVSFMSREREVLGKLQLDLDQLDLRSGVTQWYDLTEEMH
ncbi:extended synaptotagmin-1-like [Denticeps clupeoides]|uniref:extended synaptotagmin-1-like n=1 Tax=Denticeps clupeoides TaxID=299321 RepID=UPI0010A3F67B|nr:extended synaptotagmin-1-like [Denticeps clupeoides]XP_028824875.1 extended synaptotagmin-1-like [Denticeps clupeoides]